MRIGIGSDFLEYIPDYDTRFARLKELGFDAIDFNMCNTKMPWYQDVKEMERHCAEAKAAAEKYGLEIFQMHGPWPTDDSTPESREIVWDWMRRSIYGCHLLGCKHMVVHPQMPYRYLGIPEDPEVAKQITVDMLRFLLPDCQKYGVILCLENMPFRRQRISTTDRIVEVVKEIDSPWLQICFDTGHSPVMYENVPESIHLCAPWLKVFHIHDNKYDDEHSFPFFGRLDWTAIAKAIAQIGYDGVLNFEVRRATAKMAPALREAYITAGVASVKQLQKMVEDAQKEVAG